VKQLGIEPGRLRDSRRFLRQLQQDGEPYHLPDGVGPCGENGEFHTFVYAGPIFEQPIAVRPGTVSERDGFAWADLVAEAQSA